MFIEDLKMDKSLNVQDALSFLSENEGVGKKGFYKFMDLPDSEEGERKGKIIIEIMMKCKLIDDSLKLTDDGEVMLKDPKKYAYLFKEPK